MSDNGFIFKNESKALATEAAKTIIESHVKHPRFARFLDAVATDAINGKKPRTKDILGLALSSFLSRSRSF